MPERWSPDVYTQDDLDEIRASAEAGRARRHVEDEKLDRMFGEGQWIWHEPCPGLGVSGAWHHKRYHERPGRDA